MNPNASRSIRIKDVLFARCPSCHEGKVTNGIFGIHKNCQACGYNFYPEPGYYLGAMMVSYLVTAVLMVPTIIALKVSDVEPGVLFGLPLVQLMFIGPLLLHYSKVLWLHLEHSMTDRLDGQRKR